MPQDFQALYAKALAARQAKCKCQGGEPSLACPLHATQAQALIDDNAPLPDDTDTRLEFDMLGLKLHGCKTVYFAALNCHQTRNGLLQKITHLAVIREHGKPLAHARHRFEVYVWPEGAKNTGEAMDDKPILQALTPAFMFHHRQSAIDQIRHMLATQF